MSQQSNGSNAYAWYVVLALMLTYMISLCDRQILSLMISPVRSDLDLSDTEISLLLGFAFALFYTSFGVLLGWVADVWNRRNLIFIGLAVWGAATIACGFATSFASLFAARMIVGMGEAALSPAAYSMIHDYCRPDVRGRAMSVYGFGVVLGAGAAYIAGGAVIGLGEELVEWFSHVDSDFLQPWRVAFVAAGGLSLLALGMIATIREPARRKDAPQAPDAARTNPFVCVRYIWSSRLFHGRIILGVAIGSIVFNGIFAWVPSHFIRVFGWTASEIGLWFGMILLFFGAAGMWLGGYWSDRLMASRREDGAAKVVFLGETGGGISAMFFGFAPTYELAILVLCACVFCFSAAIAVGPVALQAAAPVKIRSQMIALYLLLANVLGLGIGPTMIAGVSDFLLRDENLIGMALSIIAMVVMPVASFLLFGAWKLQSRGGLSGSQMEAI